MSDTEPLDLTAVSLFAGVGGFDLALQRNGVEVVAAVEIDPAARGVLADDENLVTVGTLTSPVGGGWRVGAVAALTANGVGTCGADDNQAQAGHLVPVGGEGVSTAVRRLTPRQRETERLQGFEDDWTAQRLDEKSGRVVAQADSARYRQMGNAVAVPVVEWIIGRIVTTDGPR